MKKLIHRIIFLSLFCSMHAFEAFSQNDSTESIINSLWKNISPEFRYNQKDSMTFINLPVYSLTESVSNYSYSEDFKKFISRDLKKVSVFVIKNHCLIGHFSGNYKNGNWQIGQTAVFNENLPMMQAEKILKNIHNKNFFTVNPFGSIWVNKKNNTFIFDPLLGRFINVKRYVRKRVTIPVIRETYKNMQQQY